LLKQAGTCVRFVELQADGKPNTDWISAPVVPHLSMSGTMAVVLRRHITLPRKRRDRFTQRHLARRPGALYVRHRTAECQQASAAELLAAIILA